jgi:hypothetical protein
MKYADVQVGQQVLVNRHRANHRQFTHKTSYLGEVVAKGVPYSYRVTTGGWDGSYEDRDTTEGVVVKIYAYRRRSNVAGEPPWLDEPEYQTTTLAAKLTPAEGDALGVWQESVRSLWATEASESEAAAHAKAVIVALADHGFEVSLDRRGNLIIDSDDVPRLIKALGS